MTPVKIVNVTEENWGAVVKESAKHSPLLCVTVGDFINLTTGIKVTPEELVTDYMPMEMDNGSLSALKSFIEDDDKPCKASMVNVALHYCLYPEDVREALIDKGWLDKAALNYIPETRLFVSKQDLIDNPPEEIIVN